MPFFLLLILSLPVGSLADQNSLAGLVMKVTDGDTIIIETSEKNVTKYG